MAGDTQQRELEMRASLRLTLGRSTTRSFSFDACAVAGLALMAIIASASVDALAQVPQSSAQAPRPPATSQSQRPKQPSSPQSGAASSPSDATLRQRVEQLEEQLVDLQVVVGTVESLARAGGASSASGAYRGGAAGPAASYGSGADAGRIAALETQVQALTVQLEQMSQQMRQIQQGGAVAPSPRGPSGPAPRMGGGGFGTTTVTAADDPIANIINAPDPRLGSAPRGAAAPSSSPQARQQYDAAYSQLLQQNFPAAEAGFMDFLQAFPNDELAPNAQFWLGETYFVREQWDGAAAAFLKVGQSFPRSDKAPDSFAKLAVAMERKGNKAAACRALQELNARYPNAPPHVRSMEASTRRRAGCA